MSTSLSDAEVRARLNGTPRWLDLGILDDADVDEAARVFREFGGDEHYRYWAITRFMRRHETLTPEQCRGLFRIGAEDPDPGMGASVMIHVLLRRECPDELYDEAATHSRTQRYAAEMRRRRDFDPEQYRSELQALGPEAYYRQCGFRADGRRRKDQTVYKEMRDLFGVDFTRFHAIKDAADRPGSAADPPDAAGGRG